MVGIETSCNPEKLRKVIVVSRLAMQGFYGLTAEDKEDILLDVIYRFEMDQARFPITVYATHCRNKVIGFLGKKTAQKRMAQKVIDGTRVFFEDISLNLSVGEDSDSEYGDFIPVEDSNIAEAELLAGIEMQAPELVPLVKKVLDGEKLDRKEKTLLKAKISMEDLR